MKTPRLLLFLWLLCAHESLYAPPQSFAQSPSVKALLLFGGKEHEVFLGCLNCSAQSKSSVCNAYGKQGSTYSTDSIWNPYGTYGSAYSHFSPWNKYAQSPPVIVDHDGGSYGYLTTNEYKANRTRIAVLMRLISFQNKSEDLEETRKFLCDE